MTGGPDPAVAVITIVSGRHAHLRRQLEAFAHSTLTPLVHVVVAMDDPHIGGLVDDCAPHGHPVSLVHVRGGGDTLPLAEARNTGAAEAISRGAGLLVFLDVDCIPDSALLARYLRAATDAGPRLLFCGPVTYLPEGQPTFDARELRRFAAPHPARPAPRDDSVEFSSAMTLFWSLSFAVVAPDWEDIGGFHTGYEGYGGEDTDFALCARSKGYRIAWVGGAHAYHQHHAVSDPPVEHLRDILRNARVFHRRWGFWPMEGWLNGFADLGLIAYDAADDAWRATGRVSP
ncbi:glycosyl transferase [Gordonia paraffinivorans]|uniref:glycosyltransferase family 2 protein n=1 Tax=Gordonia paraffinivorans TaxID=175628 RepID=UPI000D610450|nr:galactosyltransferase-related protein [Gordonia paraffinivorans]PWD42782.1 glycosyl transferase [Gordonia paraffinivorans]